MPDKPRQLVTDEELTNSVRRAPPPNLARQAPIGAGKSLSQAMLENIAKRSLVGIEWYQPGDYFELSESMPVVEDKGRYRLSAWEFYKMDSWDGIKRHHLAIAPSAQGYDRQGSVGLEILDPNSDSTWTPSADGWPIFTETGVPSPLVKTPFKIKIGSGQPLSRYTVRFRVRDAHLSRISVKLSNFFVPTSKTEGYVKLWLSKEGTTTQVSSEVRIPMRLISDKEKIFSIPLYSILRPVDASMPAPGPDDTYYLTMEPEGGTVEVSAYSVIVGLTTYFFPWFQVRIFTWNASVILPSLGISVDSPIPVEMASAQRWVGQVPGDPTGAGPVNLWALPDGTFAQAALMPASLTPPAAVPPPVGDAGQDSTTVAVPAAGAADLIVEFWDALSKSFTIREGTALAELYFTVAANVTVTDVVVSILKNNSGGTTAVATRPFAGLAIMGPVDKEYKLVIPVPANIPFAAGEVLGYRIKIHGTSVPGGNLTLQHARGTHQAHLEAMITA